MFALRPTRFLARMVLAWFMLALGVAVASPLIKPQSWQMVCSASGGVKLLSVDDNGSASAGVKQIDCPLCWVASAPPPTPARVLAAQALPPAQLPWLGTLHGTSRPAPPLPARGPPTLS